MFDNLSDRLARTIKNLRGQGRLTENNIQDTLRDVRMALLEADVALPVVKSFIEHIREKALGQEVMTSINPGQALVKIVNDELIDALGKDYVPLNFHAQPPVVILMAGLQGSGKTTTTAKLARVLKEHDKKKVLLASADVYRPAAIEQLQRLAAEVGVDFFPSSVGQQAVQIAKDAVASAKTQFADVVIIDTAGRLHIDQEMMNEIIAISNAINPTEILFVVDSMTGQDAANTAKAFNDALPLTGVILTKTDGDARGGAALSIRHITGKPIKYMGVGEKTDALEAYHPDRVASRILGMGDIVSLVEEAERKLDKSKGEKLAKKIRSGKGKTFDLEDFRDQILQMNNMGGMMGILKKLPGIGKLPQNALAQVNDKAMGKTIAIISSMTVKERRHPKLINGSRKRRISLGSGTEIQDLNRLLKQFTQMQKMMKKFSKPGAMKNMMRSMQGKLPAGFGEGFGE